MTPTTSSCARSSRTRRSPRRSSSQLATRDIQGACDQFRPVHDEGGGKDGWVSLEVDPNLAHDTQGTIEEAKRLHELVDRPNLFVKIPATKEGLPAIEESIASGIPINVTLIFSLERHREVAEAYVRGLERLVESGGDPGTIASVASFFVSRVDTEADKRLDEIGGHDELKGKLAIANAKLAYQTYKEVFSGDRWKALEDKGASVQRCLWASTSTKNPDYPDTIYVEELVGPETVNTMPRELVEAVLDHGNVRGNTIEEDLDGARQGVRGPEGGRDRLRRRRRRRSSARAWRSSPSPSRSCSPTSSPSATSWWRHERARPAAARRLGPRLRGGKLGPPHLIDVGGRPDGGAAREAPAARLRRTPTTRATTT